MSDTFDFLENKVVLVTGASRGIGRAVAIAFGKLKANVVLNYKSSQQQALEVLELVKNAGASNTSLIQADVSLKTDSQRLIEETLAKYSKIDILINNVGVQRAVLLHKMTDEDWHEVINTNLSSIFYLCRAALPSMLKAGSGRIVNIGSASGVMAHKGASSYVASKHALIGLTKVLALETADKGILVNLVAPGATDTDMIASLSDVARERLLSTIPMKRMATPQEVAEAVIWVATKATYSTGNVFHVGGGVVLG